jgi:GntR family transcriptional regulator
MYQAALWYAWTACDGDSFGRCPPDATDAAGGVVGSTRRTPERSSPLYLWLAELLREQIEAGRLGAHVPVPSERVLSERYDVSRMTARHALETLTLEGYLYRHPRRGTFVAEPRLRFSVGSFTRNMTEAERTPGAKVLSAATLDPDPVVAGQLGVAAGGRVHVLQRLRSAMGEPVAIEHIQLSAARFPGLLDHDLAGSLWVLLHDRYGVRPAKADARVVAVTLDRFEAEALGVKPGSPALVLTRVVYDTDGGVLELARDVYRGDRTEFEVTAPVEEGRG